MSLINEALRRAEADRRGESPAAPAVPASPARPARRRGRFSRRIALAAGLLLLAGGAAGWYLLKGGHNPARPQAAVANTSKAMPIATQGQDLRAAALLSRRDGRGQAQRALNGDALAAQAASPGLSGDPVTPEDGLPDEIGTMCGVDSPLAKASPAAPAAATTQPTVAVPPAPAPQSTAAAPVPATPPVDLKRYKVTGVLLDSDGGTAIVNDRLVRVGDTVDDAKVVKITGRSVHVEIAGKVYVLGT